MKKGNIWGILQRGAAVFFTWTSIGLAVCSLCTLRFYGLLMAVVWYFIGGGLVIQQLRDMEKLSRGKGGFNNE